ncbi:hypothetical protein GCM10023201_25490 [Actinomycetospora corticicola]|uniref:Uncharacterized protein n=1 Tax=Actinomycetospora corticicola TaxID=663602 RepID=A0A7Y9DXH0_9PSEU|nr:hypothetical protein [Actinomycetospora corticicola]NYD37317.1 hypothetical protein [Actinomycetospora corticicola]
MTDPRTDADAPTDRADDTPADPPHPGPDDDAEPAFDIDLDPEDQGTAEAAADSTD